MELALYCPIYGYYEKEADNPGRKGDFYTSVSVGPLFGQLLGFEFAQWLERIPAPGTGPEEGKSESGAVQIVEAGAHDGRLARDILNWLRQTRPALFDRVEYIIAEPSERLRVRQKEHLVEFPRLRWVGDVSELTGVRGVIFSNELLDAMPLHRYEWNRRERKWFELGVSVQPGGFQWARLTAPWNEVPGWPLELSNMLSDGFIAEASEAAIKWWRVAAKSLGSGRLLTFDYGLEMQEMMERTGGTLRSYQQHRVGDNVLDKPGTRDLTAHVNFTAIREAGEAMGLQTEWFGRQEAFLTRIVARVWENSSGFGEWGSKQSQQFQTLAHPEHLGRFRVLLQKTND